MQALNIELGAGWKNNSEDEKNGFLWSTLSSKFYSKNRNQNYRLQITLGTPSRCVVRLYQLDKPLRSFGLNEGWHSLYTEIDSTNGAEFSLVTEREQNLDNNFGVMVSRIEAQDYVNNSFYTTNEEKKSPTFQKDKPFISAYYYLWYFSERSDRCANPLDATKWKEGYLRALLDPPQYPTLGEYVMNDPNVIEAHIDWAADHGIDCFICNWEGMVGHRKFLSENLVHILQGSKEEGTFCEAKIPYSTFDSTGHGWDATSQGWHTTGYQIRNLKRMKFSIMLESRLLLENWPPNLDDDIVYTTFSDAITYCAENFFASPQWLRINGKPVVYIYEMQTWIGSPEQFAHFKQTLDAAAQKIFDPLTGKRFEGVYVIADCIYASTSNLDRFIFFDALAGYQPYQPWPTGCLKDLPSEWIPRGSGFYACDGFQNYYRKFKIWSEKNNIPIIPTVVSRYNDRGVRGALDNYAFPPASFEPYTDVADVRQGKLFIDNIRNVTKFIDNDINMLNINSWNEWFEDTAIEPCGYVPSSPYPDYFKQGSNVGTSTSKGFGKKVPDKVVIYGKNGHQWIDTPEELRIKGIDLTQGFTWPCYGFDYLKALKKYYTQES